MSALEWVLVGAAGYAALVALYLWGWHLLMVGVRRGERSAGQCAPPCSCAVVAADPPRRGR